MNHTIRRPRGSDLMPRGGGYHSVAQLAILVRHVVEPEVSEDVAKCLALMMLAEPGASGREARVGPFVEALERALARFDAGERPDPHGHLPQDRAGCYCGRVR